MEGYLIKRKIELIERVKVELFFTNNIISSLLKRHQVSKRRGGGIDICTSCSLKYFRVYTRRKGSVSYQQSTGNKISEILFQASTMMNTITSTITY